MAIIDTFNLPSLNNGNSIGSAFNPIYVFTSSTTWTVPFDGKYRVVCVGKGGDGGDGAIYQSTQTVYGIAGSGGGSGAVCIGTIECVSGETHSISITTSSTNFSSGKLIANAGGDGIDGAGSYSSNNVPSSNSGGSGGTYSGTHVEFGVSGVSGAGTSRGTGHVTGRTAILNGGQGGSTQMSLWSPYCHGGKIGAGPLFGLDGIMTIPTNSSADVTYGGYSGTGGDGAGAYVNYYNNSSTSSTTVGTGGKGGPGIVLIEYLG